MGIFFRRSMAAISVVGGPIMPIFELVPALMHAIITCKYEKNQMKNSREKWRHRFFPVITLSVTMETGGWIWPNFKLIQALMYVIVTYKYEKDLIKNSREKEETPFSPLKAYVDFFRRSRAANSSDGGPHRLKFELVQALMHDFITCKYEKDWVKKQPRKS